MDLVKVMAPACLAEPSALRAPGPSLPLAGLPPARGAFGAAATTAAAITATITSLTDAALKVAPAVMKAIKADQALAKKEMVRYNQLKKKLERVKDEELVASIKLSMAASLERAELYKLKALISAGDKIPQGPRLEGTAMEIRRNVLANEWDGVTDAGEKKRIEALIADYDRQLLTLEYALKATLSEELESRSRGGSRQASPPAGSSSQPRPTVTGPWTVVSEHPLEAVLLFGLGFASSRLISSSSKWLSD